MSNMQRINMANAAQFPRGLDFRHLHTQIPGMAADRELVQQGDLYFQRLPSMPVGNRRLVSNSLAVSATTGARHIACGDVQVWQPLDAAGAPFDNLLYMQVGSGGAEVVHSGGDHATMLFDEGVQAVVGVVDIDPLDERGTLLRRAD